MNDRRRGALQSAAPPLRPASQNRAADAEQPSFLAAAEEKRARDNRPRKILVTESADEVQCFSCNYALLPLRSYQVEVAWHIVDSVMQDKGLSFVVMFPRQSGKNELQAQMEVYLLALLKDTPAEIVKISPTWKPQSLNAMRRLQRVLEKNCLTRKIFVKESGYIFRVGQARIFFFSGAPEANIVGATASTLLEVDEAQDVLPAKFDKDVAPMAASTNATRVFWGTAWTPTTLLARELRAAARDEAQDGRRRVFRITADEVAAEVPAYGKYVARQVALFGRSHPNVRTQFYSEEIDAEGGLFPLARQALMQGTHPAADAPQAGRMMAFLIDVGGASEAGGGAPGSHDSTALTGVEVDLTTISDPALRAPTYRVLFRRVWTNVPQPVLYAHIQNLAALWSPRRVVMDATGIGAGLAAFLERALPGRVMPFLFNAASKSKLGWDFLAIVDAGRWKDYAPPDRLFFRQLSQVQYQIVPGPARQLRWSVPEAMRDPESGELVHDDLVLSAALVGVLEGLPWSAAAETMIIPSVDPLPELDQGF